MGMGREELRARDGGGMSGEGPSGGRAEKLEREVEVQRECGIVRRGSRRVERAKQIE